MTAACNGVFRFCDSPRTVPLLLCRYSSYTKDTKFSVGLQDIAENDVEKVKKIIDDTIDKVVR